MRSPREPLFLARQSYRRRRLADAAKVLPLVGLILLILPVTWAADARTGTGLIYLFGAWAVLIAIVGVMSSRLSNVTPEETIEGDDVASHE